MYWAAINPETDAKPLYYSLLKFKYSPSIYLKHKKDSNKYASLNNSHRNPTNRILYQKIIFKSTDRSLHPTGHISWIILGLWGFVCIRDAERRGKKITSFKINSFYCLGTNMALQCCWKWTKKCEIITADYCVLDQTI